MDAKEDEDIVQEILAVATAHGAPAMELPGSEKIFEVAMLVLKFRLSLFLSRLSHIEWQGEHEAGVHQMTSARYLLSVFLEALDKIKMVESRKHEHIISACVTIGSASMI